MLRTRFESVVGAGSIPEGAPSGVGVANAEQCLLCQPLLDAEGPEEQVLGAGVVMLHAPGLFLRAGEHPAGWYRKALEVTLLKGHGDPPPGSNTGKRWGEIAYSAGFELILSEGAGGVDRRGWVIDRPAAPRYRATVGSS